MTQSPSSFSTSSKVTDNPIQNVNSAKTIGSNSSLPSSYRNTSIQSTGPRQTLHNHIPLLNISSPHLPIAERNDDNIPYSARNNNVSMKFFTSTKTVGNDVPPQAETFEDINPFTSSDVKKLTQRLTTTEVLDDILSLSGGVLNNSMASYKMFKGLDEDVPFLNDDGNTSALPLVAIKLHDNLSLSTRDVNTTIQSLNHSKPLEYDVPFSTGFGNTSTKSLNNFTLSTDGGNTQRLFNDTGSTELTFKENATAKPSSIVDKFIHNSSSNNHDSQLHVLPLPLIIYTKPLRPPSSTSVFDDSFGTHEIASKEIMDNKGLEEILHLSKNDNASTSSSSHAINKTVHPIHDEESSKPALTSTNRTDKLSIQPFLSSKHLPESLANLVNVYNGNITIQKPTSHHTSTPGSSSTVDYSSTIDYITTHGYKKPNVSHKSGQRDSPSPNPLRHRTTISSSHSKKAAPQSSYNVFELSFDNQANDITRPKTTEHHYSFQIVSKRPAKNYKIIEQNLPQSAKTVNSIFKKPSSYPLHEPNYPTAFRPPLKSKFHSLIHSTKRPNPTSPIPLDDSQMNQQRKYPTTSKIATKLYLTTGRHGKIQHDCTKRKYN